MCVCVRACACIYKIHFLINDIYIFLNCQIVLKRDYHEEAATETAKDINSLQMCIY